MSIKSTPGLVVAWTLPFSELGCSRRSAACPRCHRARTREHPSSLKGRVQAMSIKSTLGLVVALAAVAAATGVAQSISGQAFGVFVNTPAASQSQAPLAVMPAISVTDGDIAHADDDVLGVPNTLSSSFLNST